MSWTAYASLLVKTLPKQRDGHIYLVAKKKDGHISVIEEAQNQMSLA